jgi:hypothetical protein
VIFAWPYCCRISSPPAFWIGSFVPGLSEAHIRHFDKYIDAANVIPEAFLLALLLGP